jgi:hypothetical protein
MGAGHDTRLTCPRMTTSGSVTSKMLIAVSEAGGFGSLPCSMRNRMTAFR